MIAIPRRQIDAELQAFFPAGIGQLAQHVAFAAAPRAARDGVGRQRRGPQAEPVVMLGRDDDATKTGLLEDAHPLPRVERRRVEERGILAAAPPLDISERVRPEVDEGVRLHPPATPPGTRSAAAEPVDCPVRR